MAKDFGVPTKTVTALVGEFFDKPKSGQQVLTEEQLNVLFDVLTQRHQVDSLEEVLSAQQQPKAEAAPAEPKAAPAPKAEKPAAEPEKKSAQPAPQQPKAEKPAQPAPQQPKAEIVFINIAVAIFIGINKMEHRSSSFITNHSL